MRKPLITVSWRNWFLGAGFEPARGVILSLGPLSFLFRS